MPDLERQFEEDRALRNTARAVFRKELAHVRRETKPGAIGERIANSVGRKADEATDAAVDFADSHGKTIAAVAIGAVAAAGLWFARGPITEAVQRVLGNRNEEDAGDDWDETEEYDDE